MALTRPSFTQLTTTTTAFNDPITVLNQGSASANVDVGFLFNRANGLVSNVALYWSEATQSFVTAYTTATGTTNANVTPTSYANVRTGNITAAAFFWANGAVFSSSSYGNTDVAAYLPTNATITGIQANSGAYQTWANTRITTVDANLGTATTNITTLFSNAAGQANQITGANAAIVTANTGLKSYVDTQDSAITTAWTANAAGQANQITGANAAIVTANSAVVSFVGMVNSNLSTAITANTNAANTAATTANTNMKSYVDTQDSAITTAWTSNAATQATSINTINANIGSFYQYANANLGTATTNITTLFSNAATQATSINSINANLGSYQNTTNANLGTATTNITTLFSNAATQATSLNSINANLGSYQNTTNANLGTATTNITNLQSNAGTQQSQINSIVTNANANVAAYLPTYSGSLGGTLTTAAQTNITSVGTLTGLTSSGIVNITNSTQSNDTTTGALVVTGGAAVGANLHVGGSLHITGNLEVNGTQTIFNTNVSVIEDSMIYLGDDNTGDSVDIGLVSSFTNPAYQHTGFVRDASDGVWKLFANVVAEPTTIVDFTSATYSPLRIGALTATSGTYSGAIIASTVNAGTIGNSGATLTGTLSTAAQASVTSVGTLTGLTVSGTTALAGTTAGTINATSGNIGTLAVTTGLSTANAVVTGGSINNATVGATTHTTGRFTTVTATTVNAGTIGNASAAFSGASATLTGILIATTVNAGTIGNSGATLTGTLSSGAQNNITSATGITALGTITSLAATTAVATNFSSGNIVFTNATSGTVSTANVSLYESVTATTTNATHYPMLSGTATGNTASFTSSSLVYNPSTGNLVLAGTTTSTSTTTGALVVAGGAGIAGNLNVGGPSTISISSANDALRITQTGSGNVLVVEDSVNPDATSFVITANGQVGVGNVSPQATLHVKGNSGVGGLHTDFIVEAEGSGNARFFLKTATNNRNWEFFAAGSDGGFGVYDGVGVARRFTILPSGNVGINSSTPVSNLSIGTTTSTSTATPITMDLGGTFSSSAGSNGKLKVWYDGSSSYMGLGVSANQLDYIVSSSSYSHVWYQGGAEKMRLAATSGNVAISTTTASTNTTTGALVVAGGAGIAGRVTAGNIMTTSGVYWANGAAYSSGSGGGITYTASATAPGSPSAGNFWYDTAADVKYQYINDGTSSYWVDQSYPTSFGNLTVANTLTVSGSIVGTTTNANYASAANVSLYESVAATTTNATFYPMLSGIAAGNTASFTSSSLVYNPSTGNLVVASTTASTSTTTGALVVSGGVGIAGNIVTAGTANKFTGCVAIGSSNPTHKLQISLDGYNTRISDSTNATGYNIGRNTTDGLLYFYGDQATYNGYVFSGADGERVKISSTGNLVINATTSSSATTSGALVVKGGAGIAGTMTVGGLITGKPGTGGVAAVSNDTGSISIRGDATNAAVISFHRPSIYAINMGLDTDNVFKIGGWSATANCFQLTGAGALTLTGGITTTGNIVPSANLTYNLGSTTAWWNNVYGVSVQAKYADLAEHYTADDLYGPGTVVVFGGTKEITVSNISHDPRVAGVISTNPAYLMNAANAGLPVALTGRVPCQVQGPVAKGDRLVNIDTGIAGRLDPALHEYGCIVGKSLGEIADDSIQTIEIVVGRF